MYWNKYQLYLNAKFLMNNNQNFSSQITWSGYMKKMESFSKMALMAEPTMFHIGEVVGYRERICLVKSITATNHGFNTFELEDIDEDVVYVAYKHELVKAIDLPALSLGQEGEFAEILVRPMPEGAVPTAEAAVPDSAPLEHPVSNPAATGGRFVRLTAAEVRLSGQREDCKEHQWTN